MNDSSNNTWASDPLAPHGPMTCSVNMDALRQMNMEETHALRDVLRTIIDVAIGIGCQPRFLKDGESAANNAGDVLESIVEWLGSYESALINVAVASTTSTARDTEWRAWTILGFEASMADDLSSFAVLAAEAVRDMTKARRKDSRASA